MNNLKETITSKYVEMVSKRNVDKITVKDLVAECGISRQSFYYHFQDLPEVAEYYLSERFAEVSKKCREAKDFKEALQIFVRHYLSQKEFHQKLFTSKYREQYERIGSLTVKSYLDDLILAHQFETDLSYNELEMIITFMAYGIMGVLVESFKNNEFDEETFVNDFYNLLKGPINYIYDHHIYKNKKM